MSHLIFSSLQLILFPSLLGSLIAINPRISLLFCFCLTKTLFFIQTNKPFPIPFTAINLIYFSPTLTTPPGSVVSDQGSENCQYSMLPLEPSPHPDCFQNLNHDFRRFIYTTLAVPCHEVSVGKFCSHREFRHLGPCYHPVSKAAGGRVSCPSPPSHKPIWYPVDSMTDCSFPASKSNATSPSIGEGLVESHQVGPVPWPHWGRSCGPVVLSCRRRGRDRQSDKKFLVLWVGSYEDYSLLKERKEKMVVNKTCQSCLGGLLDLHSSNRAYLLFFMCNFAMSITHYEYGPSISKLLKIGLAASQAAMACDKPPPDTLLSQAGSEKQKQKNKSKKKL
ncbi:putative signal peptide protein [Puccinia sorghi]|uniref:Putative signal peptide protein n=1 Tax=Puccinia sorghi TaxID=27349 RepID=A0A0L6VLY5_9BASI|nr:putative signal peptide protein [Puccinia sorghi]